MATKINWEAHMLMNALQAGYPHSNVVGKFIRGETDKSPCQKFVKLSLYHINRIITYKNKLVEVYLLVQTYKVAYFVTVICSLYSTRVSQ